MLQKVYQLTRTAVEFQLFTVLYLMIAVDGGAQQKNVSNVISYPQSLPKEVALDIQYLLQRSTGQSWSMQADKPANTGLILSLKPEGNYKTGESCLVNSDGSSFLKFDAPTIYGLIYGVYEYFRDLGFKFYLPDSLYTIIPKLQSIFKKTSVLETPFLRIRDFAGTGGFGSGLTDPGLAVQKSWQLWKWRNGFGAEFSLGGHVGETFNLDNAKALEQHPDWTASPIMKNGKVDVSTKLNYYNNAAVDFFTDWVIKKYTDKNYKAPPPYVRDMVSIEPADAAGYIASAPAGSDLKTISDQVFYAANVAAQKLDRLFPDRPNIGVSLYAYSGHADVPGFALNPRVFVQIIPYQFQNVAFGPAFIKRWSAKVKRFGLYDYFKYPDSYWDMPGAYTLDLLMKRAINAAAFGSEGTTYETSYSKFSTGIPLWVLSSYMCTGDPNWQKNYSQLITDLYGKAAPAIQNLFDIFYNQAHFELGDLKRAAGYVQSAQQLTSDLQILRRIEELREYLVYAYLFLKSQDPNNGDLEQRLLPVGKIAWTLYQKKIIHSYRIMQLVSYSFLNANPPDKSLADHYRKLHALTFPESNDAGAFWKKDDKYQANDINSLYSELSKLSVSVQNTSATIDEEVSAADLAYNPMQTLSFQSNSYNRGFLNLFAKKPTKMVVSYSVTNSNNASPTITISGVDKSYKIVYDYPLKSRTGNISISIPAGESAFFVNATANTTYQLQVQLNNAFCYFDGSPRGIMAFLNSQGTNSYDPSYYPSYVFVPKNTQHVQYKVQVNALKILDPDGKPVATKKVGSSADFELRSFDVPANYAGKFWMAIVSGNFNYQFLNIPDRYFLLTKK